MNSNNVTFIKSGTALRCWRRRGRWNSRWSRRWLGRFTLEPGDPVRCGRSWSYATVCFIVTRCFQPLILCRVPSKVVRVCHPCDPRDSCFLFNHVSYLVQKCLLLFTDAWHSHFLVCAMVCKATAAISSRSSATSSSGYWISDSDVLIWWTILGLQSCRMKYGPKEDDCLWY